MSRSLAIDGVRTHEKSLRQSLADIPTAPARMGIDENQADVSAGIGAPRAAVREAMRRADLSQKAFAICAKSSEGNVSEGFSGVRQIPWAWIWAQDKPFRVHFVQVLREAWDVDEDADVNELEAMCGRVVTMAMRVSRGRRSA